jgi:hypothetical protein
MVADVEDPSLVEVDLKNPGDEAKYLEDTNHVHYSTAVAVKTILDNLVEKLNREHAEHVDNVNLTKDVATKARAAEKIAFDDKEEAISFYNVAKVEYDASLDNMYKKIDNHKTSVATRVTSVDRYHSSIVAHNTFAENMAKEKDLISKIHKLMCNLHGVRAVDYVC